MFIKDIKELTHPDKIPKDIKKLMIFDGVIVKEPITNEYFCRARHENCDMIYLKQKIFSADRQNSGENCNLFIFFEQTGKATMALYSDHFNVAKLSYKDFSKIFIMAMSRPYNYIVIDKSKNRYDCVKLRIHLDWRVL